ncbi:hypothetical protein IOD16_20055 [Saccharothrix sp. 6-C]|uniref:hypothetical protein n=1 Tax=Saccharothrix sp. 6-C TaxID=2781735 RepID=UPI001917637A|nr:hypothetical protein [Saccharothrix sp. 6-C]QQQ73583.1 hypothetical protein IOD16_20055 [Saccharothrix sp. 6-C]
MYPPPGTTSTSARSGDHPSATWTLVPYRQVTAPGRPVVAEVVLLLHPVEHQHPHPQR